MATPISPPYLPYISPLAMPHLADGPSAEPWATRRLANPRAASRPYLARTSLPPRYHLARTLLAPRSHLARTRSHLDLARIISTPGARARPALAAAAAVAGDQLLERGAALVRHCARHARCGQSRAAERRGARVAPQPAGTPPARTGRALLTNYLYVLQLLHVD